MSLSRSTSKSKFTDTPESSDVEPPKKKPTTSSMAQNMDLQPQSESHIWPNAASLKPTVIVDYISHAVCDPDLPISIKRNMYQALMLNRAATEANHTDNQFINMNLAAAAGGALYGPQYSQWIKSSYQGSTMGLPALPPPAISFPSANRGGRKKAKGRGKPRNN